MDYLDENAMVELWWLLSLCEVLITIAVIVGCRCCYQQRGAVQQAAAGGDADAGADAARPQARAQPAAVDLPHFPFPYAAGPYPHEGGDANGGMPRADQAQPPAPEVAQLPYFPYAPRGGGRAASELTSSVVCAICLEQLRRGELCSEVPACRHVFHRECVALWMKTSDSCPLCRAKITPRIVGSIGAPPVADMV